MGITKENHPPALPGPARVPDPHREPAPEPGATPAFFNENAAAILQGIFTPFNAYDATGAVSGQGAAGGSDSQATTASVKFMITTQDEKELLALGYTQAQIDRLKPEEAADILKEGRKPSHDPDQH